MEVLQQENVVKLAEILAELLEETEERIKFYSKSKIICCQNLGNS